LAAGRFSKETLAGADRYGRDALIRVVRRSGGQLAESTLSGHKRPVSFAVPEPQIAHSRAS